MRHRLNKIVRTFGAAESICEFSDESLLFDCAPMWNDPRQSKMKNPGVTHARRDACRTVCRARMLLRWIYRFPVDRRRDAMRRIPASAPVPYSRRPAQGRRSAIDDPACRCLVEFRSRAKDRRAVPVQLRGGWRCDVDVRSWRDLVSLQEVVRRHSAARFLKNSLRLIVPDPESTLAPTGYRLR